MPFRIPLMYSSKRAKPEYWYGAPAMLQLWSGGKPACNPDKLRCPSHTNSRL